MDLKEISKSYYHMFQHHYVINLTERPDRWTHITSELKKIGIDEPNRFSGIKSSPGIIGCGRSHLKCLRVAREKKYPYVTIFEDDACFLDPETLLRQIKHIMNNETFDVLLCGYNAFKPHLAVSDNYIRVTRAYCGTMYIVKFHYYDTLIRNIEESLDLMQKTGDTKRYPWDAWWVNLQRRDKFLAVCPPTVTQKPDYSDIEERHTNYVGLMLDVNK
jgi:hypothetical protein